jgi:hypothetical protein
VGFFIMAGGRPEAVIDWNEVEQLLMSGCSGTEIAARIGIAAATLYDRCQTDNEQMFSEYSQEKKSKGDTLIKQAQFEAATVDKDKAMLIWLGKQRLGQKDKIESDLNHNGGVQIIMNKVESSKPSYEIKFSDGSTETT